MRATLFTNRVRKSAYVAFNGDRHDPENERLGFYKYFYEPLAQDHPGLPGGALQIGVVGAPAVEVLEEWYDSKHEWITIWRRAK